MEMIHYETYDSLHSHRKINFLLSSRDKSTKIVKFMAQESRQLIMKCFFYISSNMQPVPLLQLFLFNCVRPVTQKLMESLLFVRRQNRKGYTFGKTFYENKEKSLCPPQIFLYVKKKLGGMGHLHVVTYYVLK